MSSKCISIYLQARYLLSFAESKPSEFDNNSNKTENTDKAAPGHTDDVNRPNNTEEQDKEVFNLKDIGNQNFYFLYLLGILTEYLISYFGRFVAFSC